jgi:Spy/CpxP family protein refolding chaperone
MNRASSLFGVIALSAASFALAQVSGSSQAAPPAGTSAPPAQYQQNTPSSSAQSESAPNADTNTKSAKKAQMDDCMAQQRASNPSMSKHDMKKACKKQLESTSHE